MNRIHPRVRVHEGFEHPPPLLHMHEMYDFIICLYFCAVRLSHSQHVLHVTRLSCIRYTLPSLARQPPFPLLRNRDCAIIGASARDYNNIRCAAIPYSKRDCAIIGAGARDYTLPFSLCVFTHACIYGKPIT